MTSASAAAPASASIVADYPPLPPRRVFAVGETCALAAVKPSTLRYWESRLPALGKIGRVNGRRMFTPRQVLLIRQVRDLVRRDGYTVDGAQAALAARAHGNGGGGDSAKAATTAAILAARREIDLAMKLL